MTEEPQSCRVGIEEWPCGCEEHKRFMCPVCFPEGDASRPSICYGRAGHNGAHQDAEGKPFLWVGEKIQLPEWSEVEAMINLARQLAYTIPPTTAREEWGGWGYSTERKQFDLKLQIDELVGTIRRPL